MACVNLQKNADDQKSCNLLQDFFCKRKDLAEFVLVGISPIRSKRELYSIKLKFSDNTFLAWLLLKLIAEGGSMMAKQVVLAINPGSTSTKVAVIAEDGTVIWQETLRYSVAELAYRENVVEQLPLRLSDLERLLAEKGLGGGKLVGVVGRGGLLRPLHSGTYLVNEAMLADLRQGWGGQHPSNLGGILARMLADRYGVEAYIVDPVSVDEMIPEARRTGLPEIRRFSHLHALNIRRALLRWQKEQSCSPRELTGVAVHLGGGITVAAVRQGRIIDVSNANQGGPMSPERAGALPSAALAYWPEETDYHYPPLAKRLVGGGGLVSYLETNSLVEAEKRAEAGDEKARLALQAMVKQLIKEIGAMAAILDTLPRFLLFTGGMAFSHWLMEQLTSALNWLAPITVYPGEEELPALAEGVFRVLAGEESVRIYPEGVSGE